MDEYLIQISFYSNIGVFARGRKEYEFKLYNKKEDAIKSYNNFKKNISINNVSLYKKIDIT